ncbi:hypothetical protein P7C71_g3110, partial [Lecanoromycetidae sp. Uapishka_2]
MSSSIDSSGTSPWQAALLQAAGKADEPQKVAGRGHESLTQLLLEEGAEVETHSEDEVSPLWRAAELGRVKIVELLLHHGASTEARDKSKRTPLFAAAIKGHYNTLKLLIEAGADVNALDGNGQNLILCLASEKSEKKVKGKSGVTDILLETDIDLEFMDKDGRSALLWASALGKLDLACSLLTCRWPANVRATNHRGKTALHLAAENDQVSLVKLLLEHGAAPQVRSDGGWTALHNAADKGHLGVVSLLLQGNTDVNTTTSSGMTALHWAARNGHTAVVKLLLEVEGIKRNSKDSFDITPMLGAAENGHLDIVQILSPADDGRFLSNDAIGACKGFQATVVDFGMVNRPMNHVKHTVFDLLYGQNEKTQEPLVSTIIRKVPARPKFRWVHLPANNMSWVETLITKHFVENHASDVDGFKALEKTFDNSYSDLSESATETLVADGSSLATSTSGAAPLNEPSSADKIPRSNARRGGKAKKPPESPYNAHGKTFKRTNSFATDSTTSFKGDTRTFDQARKPSRLPARKPERSGNIVLYLPYLHYETDERRKEMSNAVKRSQSTSSGPFHMAMASGCDEQLVNAYLHSTHNLHIRRTLDQFYYHAISTEERDQDQVVYRYTRDKKQELKVFMVDQLWMWILDEDLVVTCFPQRWKQPKNDPLNVLDGIIEDMSSKTQSPVTSVYDLAMLVTGRCCGVFDRHRLGGEAYQFLDMFESSIGEVTEKETKLFKRFNDASALAAQWLRRQRHHSKSQKASNAEGELETDPIFVDTLLDIGEETGLLAETKDIRDELNMISMVLKHQSTILDDLSKALLEEVKGNHNQQRQGEIKRRFREQQKVVDVHLKDVERMDKQAEGIYTSVMTPSTPSRVLFGFTDMKCHP